MLTRLSIRDIVLIEALDLVFSEHLSVLTGETGAGKSILLDSLSLAMGARAESSLVRKGSSSGMVIAAFSVPLNHPVRAQLQEQGIEVEDEILLKRQLGADGKSKASINDMPVTAQLMREIGKQLVEIHGQHDDRALLDSQTHRTLLDAFGGLEPNAQSVQQNYAALKALIEQRESEQIRLIELQKEADWLTHAVAELEKMAPEVGEEDRLADERRHMQQFEKTASLLNETLGQINGSSPLLPEISSISRTLSKRMSDWPEAIEPVVDALDRALDELGKAEDLLESALSQVDYNPHKLEQIEERLFALRACARKYQVSVDDLLPLAVKYSDDLSTIENSSERLAALKAQEQKQLALYSEAANQLSQLRIKTAQKLNDAVMAELPSLKLGQAIFSALVETDMQKVSEHGFDNVQFMVQTNPGTRMGPIAKVASGGELSRFLLALKVCLSERGSAPTLIFDEIDTGVGGAVAQAMGERLARLAQSVQVLTVTHAPQVAACAQHHFLIEKTSQATHSNTTVRLLSDDERREEIARMLAGSEITSEARAAAKRLLG